MCVCVISVLFRILRIKGHKIDAKKLQKMFFCLLFAKRRSTTGYTISEHFFSAVSFTLEQACTIKEIWKSTLIAENWPQIARVNF